MKTMKTVAVTGPRECELRDVPLPRVRGEFVRIRLLVAPMCTEYKAYAAGKATAELGHEGAGVVDAADASSSVRPGDRVVVMPQYPCGNCGKIILRPWE